ncbi:MAG TPA: hypothetical protein VGM27_02765 [Acidobacteriaceae bacterium]|jgi:hypothetical protein
MRETSERTLADRKASEKSRAFARETLENLERLYGDVKRLGD